MEIVYLETPPQCACCGSTAKYDALSSFQSWGPLCDKCFASFGVKDGAITYERITIRNHGKHMRAQDGKCGICNAKVAERTCTHCGAKEE